MIADFLHVGFELPFAVKLRTIPPDWPLTIEIEHGAGGDTSAAPLLANSASSFVEAVRYGMGASEHVRPRIHEDAGAGPAVDVDNRPNGATVSVVAPISGIDVRSVTVLLHKLFALSADGLPLRRVAVDLPNAGSTGHSIGVKAAPIPDFPGRWPSHALAIESELENYASSRFVDIELGRAPSADALAVLDRGCGVWATQCIEAGYISRDFDLDRYSLVPDSPRIWGAHYEWNLDKAFLDLRAFDALTNFLIAFSEAVWPVRRLVIT